MLSVPAVFESYIMLDELPIPYAPVQSLAALETLHGQYAASLESLSPGDLPALAHSSGRLAGAQFMLGDGEAALVSISRAIQAARTSGQINLMGYLLNLMGAVQGYFGLYPAACQSFDQAEAFFSETNDLIGLAWQQQIMAREYLRDVGQTEQASAQLTSAMSVLRTRAAPHALIENLLAQADCLIRMEEFRRAADAARQAEGLIGEHRAGWYQPELHLIRGKMSLAEGNPKGAWQQGFNGLGAVGHQGDLRTLTALYLLLGVALEHDRLRLNDARDALERAITAGRKRGRRLHLALALRQMGLHLKRHSNRPTARARGSGFLFEAHRMLSEMGLADRYFMRSGGAGSSD